MVVGLFIQEQCLGCDMVRIPSINQAAQYCRFPNVYNFTHSLLI
jgi:hypothetical protein